MPVFSRKALRQSLGLNGLRDTYVGTTTFAAIAANGSVVVLDRLLADPTFSAALYQRSWLLVASVAYRVGSYNYQSGSIVTGQTAINAIASGMDFEIHSVLPPADKDRCIDDVVRRVRVRREVAFQSTDGLNAYAIDGAASPNSIVAVLDAYYFANPTNSLNRDRRSLVSKVVVQTATGLELRLGSTVPSGQQIVLDAILTLSLGSGDAATINIPDERMIIAGAEAKAYDLLMRQTPGQQSDIYKQHRQDAAREFSRLSALFKPPVSRVIQFDAPDWPAPLWYAD